MTRTGDLSTLYDKLCREQSQAEHSAELHPAREARRLGSSPPAAAFRAISAHATSLWPSFEVAMGPEHRIGRSAGVLAGKMFSVSRDFLLDRFTDEQRSYRGTLLGLQHGLDCARLLMHVARQANEVPMAGWCQRMLETRVPLVARAEDALAWFANHPKSALTRGG